MVRQEIYLLTKHANFDSKYVEDLPVHDRRFFIGMLKEEFDEIRKEREKSTTKVNRVSARGKGFR